MKKPIRPTIADTYCQELAKSFPDFINPVGGHGGFASEPLDPAMEPLMAFVFSITHQGVPTPRRSECELAELWRGCRHVIRFEDAALLGNAPSKETPNLPMGSLPYRIQFIELAHSVDGMERDWVGRGFFVWTRDYGRSGDPSTKEVAVLELCTSPHEKRGFMREVMTFGLNETLEESIARMVRRNHDVVEEGRAIGLEPVSRPDSIDDFIESYMSAAATILHKLAKLSADELDSRVVYQPNAKERRQSRRSQSTIHLVEKDILR